LREAEQASYMRTIINTQLFQDYVMQITNYDKEIKKMSSNEVFKYGQEFLTMCKEDNYSEIMEAEGDVADLINNIDKFIKTSQRIKIMYLMLRRTSPGIYQKQESKLVNNDETSPVEKKKLVFHHIEGKEQKEREKFAILEQEQYDQNKGIADYQKGAAARDATVLVAARDATMLAAADISTTDAMDADDDHRSGSGTESDEDFDPLVDNSVEMNKAAEVDEGYPLDDEEKLVDLGAFTNTEDCACFRTMKMIHCVQCGHMMVARLRRMCPTHPNVTFLLDVTACSKCTSSSNSLKEYEMPESMKQQQYPKLKKPTLLQPQPAVSRAKQLINKRTVTPAFQNRSSHQDRRCPSTPIPSPAGQSRSRTGAPFSRNKEWAGGFPRRSPVVGQRDAEPFQSSQRATDRLRNKN